MGPSSQNQHGLPELCCIAGCWNGVAESSSPDTISGDSEENTAEREGKAEGRKEREGDYRWEKRAEKARALLLMKINWGTLANTPLVPTQIVLIKIHTKTSNKRIRVSQNESHQYNQTESTSYHIQNQFQRMNLLQEAKF